MNDPLREELLGAYLDGELAPSERAEVEEWLTSSPEHRRLLRDLQALRRELQALPRQSLDPAFSDRVLAAIRAKTAGEQPVAQKPSGTSVADLPRPAAPPPSLGLPAWRWFTAGVAACLIGVLALINLAPDAMRMVVLAPEVKGEQGKAPGSVATSRVAAQPATAPQVAETEPTETRTSPITAAAKPAADAAGVAAKKAESLQREQTAPEASSARSLSSDDNAKPGESGGTARRSAPRASAPAASAMDEKQSASVEERQEKHLGGAAPGAAMRGFGQQAESRQRDTADRRQAAKAMEYEVCDQFAASVLKEVEQSDGMVFREFGRNRRETAATADRAERKASQLRDQERETAADNAVKIESLELSGPEEEVLRLLTQLEARPRGAGSNAAAAMPPLAMARAAFAAEKRAAKQQSLQDAASANGAGVDRASAPAADALANAKQDQPATADDGPGEGAAGGEAKPGDLVRRGYAENAKGRAPTAPATEQTAKSYARQLHVKLYFVPAASPAETPADATEAEPGALPR